LARLQQRKRQRSKLLRTNAVVRAARIAMPRNKKLLWQRLR
jgi:hypothetical protein